MTVAHYGQGLTAAGCGSCLRGSSGCQKRNIDQEQYHLLLVILEHTFPPIPFCVVIFLFLAFEHCPGFVESLISIFMRYLGFQEKYLVVQPFELCGEDSVCCLRSGFTLKQY